jgi:cystathionine gamma-lyase
MKDATRVVRAGRPSPEKGQPFLPGPTLAAPFHHGGEPQEGDYFYGRYANPTWSAYEEALGELEGGEVVLFASGMAAATAVFLTALRPGDVAVVQDDCYFTIREFATGHLAAHGVDVRLVPPDGLADAATSASLVWAETPSNPRLAVVDIAALRSEGLVVVDNTTATPLLQRPLELGADLAMASGTKALAGHSDLLLGYVATRDPGRAETLREWRIQGGALPGPFETWLAHRSLPTLDVRLQRSCDNAAAVAELLADRPDVMGVRYPGLASHPGHQAAARQMARFGPVVSFDVGSRSRAEAFLGGAELVTEATSFGGVQTTAERRARWGGDAVPEGFIRLSAGLEASEDLLADIAAALERS